MFKILIAEDDLDPRQLFRHVLLKNGYTVKGVSMGRKRWMPWKKIITI